MSCFKNKRFSLVIICVLAATYSFGQIRISEFLQESRIASLEKKQLFFVDFWATWCGPCVTAKEHLGVLQRQFPNDLYIVSLTKENPLLVERFLARKPTELAIAIDYYGENFRDYNVKVLPDGVLFNANGEVLWQGGAPDLKKDMISRFLRQEKTKIAVNSFFEIIETKVGISLEYVPKESFEIKRLSVNNEVLEVVDNEKYLKLSGSLKSMVSYLAKIYKNQIILEESLNTNYEVYFKKPINETDNLAFKLIAQLNLEVDRQTGEGEAVKIVIESPKFWDTNQIDWGKNNAKYLVGESQIKADNVSLKDLAYELACILDMPVILPEENEISLSLHDWDFHYKFFQLMQSDLEDNYGIKAEKKVVAFPVYHIQKKAP